MLPKKDAEYIAASLSNWGYEVDEIVESEQGCAVRLVVRDTFGLTYRAIRTYTEYIAILSE